MKKNNISGIIKNDLCTGCGICIPICPILAIKLDIDRYRGIYVPEISEKKCNNCYTCMRVCPGYKVNFNQLNTELFHKKPKNPLIGNYQNCYTGHCNNLDIRNESSSGGIITQYLIFALEQKIINGVLVTRMKNDRPWEPEPFIARTKSEIIEASKSKYCPVPANIAINEILKSKKDEKFAVVGLSCHIQGLRKAEQINKKLKDK